MKVFNRLVKKLQQERAAVNVRNLKCDYIRDAIANGMVDRFLDIKRNFTHVLDFGSGSGHVIKYLDTDIVSGKLIQFDQSKLVKRDEHIVYPIPVDRIMGDLEQLPFQENTFDAVVSCLALHWINDIPNTLKQIHSVLKPDGVFIASLFGGETLYELRTSLQLCETERIGGISPHISPMVRHQDVGGLLAHAGFELTTVDVEEITVNYPDMFELMLDLQAMGENNALLNRKQYTSKDVFMAASAAYKSIYGNPDGTIPATFQVMHMIGWKPHESQPKPLQRGSAKHSLKDIDLLSNMKQK
jgi:NADH dehydrogenase [ubiquinone] 1 alpha subcomplex assembly factor 5